MTRRQLEVSLALWRRRHRWNERMRARARRRGNVKAANRYGARLAEAVRMIKRRRLQLAAIKPLREKAFGVAETLVGVMEQGGNNVGPRVSAIIRAAGGTPGEPWCGDFVIFCYRSAGSKLVTRSWAAVRLMLTAGVQRTTDPQRGDIVRYCFDHTGLFDCWCNARGEKVAKAAASHIRAIEGNTGESGAVSDGNGADGVHRKVRPVSQVNDFLRVAR